MVELTEKEKLAKERVCLALDVSTLEEVRALVKELRPFVGLFKIGKEVFTNLGPDIVKTVQKEGGGVFLDLKYHDIPNTVKKAAKAATFLGVKMFNIHASGGAEMMKAALEGVEEGVAQYNAERPKVLGVTVLTSIDENVLNNELGISRKVEEQVLRLAKLTEKAGLDGVVCSAADLHAIKDKLKPDFMYVTPGVKGVSTQAGSDQKRVFTPGNAIQDGSTVLVIGRAITQAPDKAKAAYEILQDMAKHL